MSKLPVLPKIRTHMDVEVPTLTPDTPILEAIAFLLDKRVTGAPVLDELGHIVGIITEKDCLKVLSGGESADTPSGTVADFMTRDVVTVTPDTDVYYAAGVFLSHHFRRLPVVAAGKVVGAITRFDILRVMSANLVSADES